LLEAARRRQPLCIILDLVIPGKTGMDVLEALKPAKYPAPVLVISGQGTIANAVAALKAGAFDFIEKPFSKKQLLERVKAAIDSWQPGRMIPVRFNGPNQPLTAREIQILEWLQTGKTSKVIGKALKVSCRTVEYHRGNLMRKFGVNSVTRLLQVVLAQQVSDQTSTHRRRTRKDQRDSVPFPNEVSGNNQNP
jgi:FixJ family two-component response regulator